MPIPDLGPERFEVTIDGRKRRVVSANFVRSVTRAHDSDPPIVSAAARAETGPVPGAPHGRLFMLAIDVNSFSVGDSRGVVSAATGFIKALRPEDQVGLFSFPVGERSAPTTDHFSVITKLNTIVGAKQSMESSFHLSPAEVVDITAESAAASSGLGRATAAAVAANPANASSETQALRRVQMRECGGTTDQTCAANIRLDAESMSYFYEGQATMALNGLMSLIRNLAVVPERKTVVLMSGGITASDWPGGRPNVDDLAQALGRAAAEANTNVYALHVDTSAVQSYSAEKRRSNRAGTSQERESVMLSRLLDMFSGASGGTMLRVLVGLGRRRARARAPGNLVALPAGCGTNRRRPRTTARTAREGHQHTQRHRPQPALGRGAEEEIDSSKKRRVPDTRNPPLSFVTGLGPRRQVGAGCQLSRGVGPHPHASGPRRFRRGVSTLFFSVL